ncbi:PAS domain S-box protein [Lysobacteraceae bacterium NML120232]|nr:PAS domain S-box protein [Xanthomonadaceae bacterium NML120232]
MSKGSDTPIRMLIINDDVAAAEAIVSHLRNSGMAVRASRPADSAELAAMLGKTPFDLVLLCLPSSAISQSEVFMLVDAQGRDLPILVEAPVIDAQQLLALTEAGVRALLPRGQFMHLHTIVQREMEDLTARRGLRRLEAQLRETERRCDSLIESSRDPIAYIHEGMYIRANSAYLEMFGYEDFADIEGMPLLDMVSPKHVADFKQLLKELGKTDNLPPRHELQMRGSDGEDFPAVMEFTPAKYEGEPCLQLIIRRQELDIDPALAQEVEELRRLDMATGLLNRQTFLQQLEQRVAEAATGEHEHTLLLLEPDHLAQLYQQVGLDSVDDLASAIAERLRQSLPADMAIARVAENTYAILLQDSQYRQSYELAERLCTAFASRLLETSQKTLSATISIGGVQIGERIAQITRVLEKANESLRHASEMGGNQVHIFDPRATERAEEERIQGWIAHIKDAIAHDSLKLHYRPIINLHNESEQFHESLLRMIGTDGSLIQPGQFVPLAEEHGLANVLDRWAIRHALQSIKALPATSGQPPKVMVRIAQSSLEDEQLVPDIVKMLAETGAQAASLVLQLPESKVFTSLRGAQRINEDLKKIGASFCIEQFGTGLNSLQLLTHLQPGFLKLNHDFMEDLDSEENRERLAEIIQNAGALQIPCIAPGVDSPTAMTALFSSGATYVQGDFVAPEMPSLGN